jgi:ribosomal protein L37E
MSSRTYELVYKEETGGPVAIRCLICHRTSYHPGDVEHRYCANCHWFHEDRWVAHDGSGASRV